MADSDLYDSDFVLWTEQQAEVLRRLPSGSNELDIEHLAEEIESLGKRDVREVESLLRRIMEHVLKLWLQPSSVDANHWQGEILEWQTQIMAAYAPSMRQKIDLQREWDISIRRVGRAHRSMPEVTAVQGLQCPFTLADIITTTFDLDAFLAKFPPA